MSGNVTNSLTATVEDADALAGLDQWLADGDALVCPRDAEVWRYEIAGRRPADLVRRVVAVLTHCDDVRGYLVHGARLSTTGELIVFAATCEQPADWPQAAAAMHAHLGRVGRHYEATARQPFVAIRPLLDRDHPMVRFGPPGVPRRPGAWYARTSDPVDLLARLLPVLRTRWHAAGLRWPEPTLVIDMYGRAATLGFTHGELTSVTATRGAASPSNDPGTHAAVPPGALLQLALGHGTLPEILDAWPDCLLRDTLVEHLLTTAFPRVPVRVWPRN